MSEAELKHALKDAERRLENLGNDLVTMHRAHDNRCKEVETLKEERDELVRQVEKLERKLGRAQGYTEGLRLAIKEISKTK